MKPEELLPPEFRSGNDVPVERATITRARMIEIIEEWNRRAQPSEPVKVPSDKDILTVWADTPKADSRSGDAIAFARALLQKYGQLRADNPLKTNENHADFRENNGDSCAPINTTLPSEIAHIMGRYGVPPENLNQALSEVRDVINKYGTKP